MAQSKEVTEKKNGALALDMSVFEDDAGGGLENITQDDLALPFLKVLSGNDEVLDRDENARKGDIYNTVTGHIYKGKDGISVVPCAYQRRFIRWSPRGMGSNAPVAIFSPDEARPKTARSTEANKEYVVDGNGDYIEETHQHFVMVMNADESIETALIAMKSTQLKKSRKWNSMMQSITMQGKNGPFVPPKWSHVYQLKTVLEENSKGSWHGWEVSRKGPVSDMNIYNQAKVFAESINKGDVIVKHSQDEGDNPPF